MRVQIELFALFSEHAVAVWRLAKPFVLLVVLTPMFFLSPAVAGDDSRAFRGPHGSRGPWRHHPAAGCGDSERPLRNHTAFGEEKHTRLGRTDSGGSQSSEAQP